MTEYRVVLFGGIIYISVKTPVIYVVPWFESLAEYSSCNPIVSNIMMTYTYSACMHACIRSIHIFNPFTARRAGKSALGARFVKNHFVTEDIQTVEDLFTTRVEIDNETCCLGILDTCGTVRFSQIKQHHISYGEGFVFVFATDNKRSFEEVEIIREQVC